MPQIATGGSKPPKKPKTTVAQQKADTVLHGTGQSTTGGVHGNAATVQNYNTTQTGGFTTQQNRPARTQRQLASKIDRQQAQSDAKHRAIRRDARQSVSGDTAKRAGAFTSGGVVGGGGRTGGGGILGKPDGGGVGDNLHGAFHDPNLVGSENTITDMSDGSSFSGGGFDDVSGGGGGSGSSLAGRESVGQVGQLEGQSLDEVVYGVKKKGRKVSRARGE